MLREKVVLYLHSTSNHNYETFVNQNLSVVLYLHSTSNHNQPLRSMYITELYYIFILHQTTTIIGNESHFSSCIISSFYIKPQLPIHTIIFIFSCIISSFYIKPQLVEKVIDKILVVLYLHSTSNHN